MIRSFTPAVIALTVLVALVAMLVLSNVKARGDDFSDHLAQLKAKNAAPKADPFATTNKKSCGCTGPADCPCLVRTCVCSACAAKSRLPKPTDDDPANPWQWTDEDGGYWWRWKTTPQPVYYQPTYCQPMMMRGGFGGFRGGSCGAGG